MTAESDRRVGTTTVVTTVRLHRADGAATSATGSSTTTATESGRRVGSSTTTATESGRRVGTEMITTATNFVFLGTTGRRHPALPAPMTGNTGSARAEARATAATIEGTTGRARSAKQARFIQTGQEPGS